MVVAAFVPGTANAQLGEIMQGNLEGQSADTFACTGTGTVPCGLHQRYYPEFDPREINGGSSTVDGWPGFKAKPSRYLGDAQTTQNYPNGTTRACEPWYLVWDGATDSATGTYISYYATQSTLINFTEGGTSANAVDCTDNLGGLACFGAVDGTFGRGAAGSAQGALAPISGLSPVPVPGVVQTSNTDFVTVSVGAAAPGNNLNLPSKTGVACPGTASFDDLTDSVAPDAVFGIGLYYYVKDPAAGFRSLDDLEGAPLTSLLANPSTGMACTGTSDCPGVFFIPCSSVAGATCAGNLLSPAGTSGTVDLATIEGISGALGANTIVFMSKVHYRGSAPGTQANPGNTNVSPSVVSLFSAAATQASFNGLAARVDITDLSLRGNSVRLAWQTVGSSYVSFTVQRANDGLTFVDLATVPADGSSDYAYTDQLRGRRPAAATYRILAEDLDGNTTQVFESIELSNAQGTRGR